MATENLTTTEQTLERSDQSLRQRVLATPRPALVWLTGLTLLVLPELGALIHVAGQALAGVLGLLPGDPLVAAVNGATSAAEQIPTLLSRETIPNEGHRTAPGEWTGTFLGLEPMFAWSLRIGLIYLYAAAFLWWLWRGYDTYREQYRIADWSPADDQIDRFARHDWGRFGLIVVTIFVVMAVFAPAFGPTTIEQNNRQPYSYEVDYYNEETQTVESIVVGVANVQSTSDGSSAVGPWSYDEFDRFHPMGTLQSGKDMMTFLAHGARVSLFIGGISIAMSGFVAVVLALVTAYYKGLADLITVVTSDSIQVIPQFLLLIMAAAVFSNHWLSSVFNGGLLLVALFAFTNWTFIWRTIRGPALQVAERTQLRPTAAQDDEQTHAPVHRRLPVGVRLDADRRDHRRHRRAVVSRTGDHPADPRVGAGDRQRSEPGDDGLLAHRVDPRVDDHPARDGAERVR